MTTPTPKGESVDEQSRLEVEKEYRAAAGFGLSAIEHVGMACRANDRRIAHEFHELRARSLARLAARHAFRAVPSLLED